MKRSNLLMFIFLLLATGKIFAQTNVPVQWMHGLNGEPARWNIYAPLFEGQREMVSNTPEYNIFSKGVRAARTQVQGQLGNNRETILIGHSMGGLVARDFERAFGSSRTRGIVTVGSPNQGAMVATNILNGNAQIIFTRGIADMTAGPVAEGKYTISSIVSAFTGVPSVIVNQITTKRIDEYVQDVMFAAVDDLIDDLLVDRHTLEDFQVNGSYITSLNNRVSQVPLANIICEENNRAPLRLANAKMDPPQNTARNAYDDSGVIRTANNLQSVYKVFKDVHAAHKWLNPLRYDFYNGLEEKWRRGENYLKSNFEADYSILIGATRSYPVTKYFKVQVCNDDCDILGRVQYCEPPLPEDCHYEWKSYSTSEVRTQVSDGLIPLTDQMLPGRTINHPDVYHAMEVSHMEVGNHRNIELEYIRIFNRGDELHIPLR